MAHQVQLFINGEFVPSKSERFIPVTDPATQDVIAQVPCTTAEEMAFAIASAKEAFKSWKEVPVSERARLMMRFAHLLKEHQAEIADIICRELGKTVEDAKGDVWRGIEVVEQAANIPSLMMGETVENVARSIDTYSYIQPLGVCAGITPFNFPAMIPLWMFPMAIACGNTFILKPSEQDPMTVNKIAELFALAGAPKGVLQVVHGNKEQVDVLLRHPDIKAISFVGSVNVGQYIYKTGTDHLKRVQAFAGAKNHMVVMPDANKQQVINALVGASVGAAGQRCMAISVAVFVGAAAEWIPDVAAAVDMSGRHFERLFKRETGQSPLRYYRHLRLSKARQRVLYSNDSFREIAVSVGYPTPAPMARHYQELFGVSPKDERRLASGLSHLSSAAE